jgi:hypothetical protein
MKYLLDTSALLVFYRKEPEVGRVLMLLEDSQSDVLLCALSVAEFGRKLHELGQPLEEIERTIDLHLPLFTRVEKVDDRIALASLRLIDSLTVRLPAIDSLIAATALVHEACLVHKDKHMAAIPPEVLPTLNLAQS